MNETEKQIVAWLRDLAEAEFVLAKRVEGFPHSTLATVYSASAETKLAVANAIERGEHRDKQDG